jgi:hypothetical protein
MVPSRLLFGSLFHRFIPFHLALAAFPSFLLICREFPEGVVSWINLHLK